MTVSKVIQSTFFRYFDRIIKLIVLNVNSCWMSLKYHDVRERLENRLIREREFFIFVHSFFPCYVLNRRENITTVCLSAENRPCYHHKWHWNSRDFRALIENDMICALRAKHVCFDVCDCFARFDNKLHTGYSSFRYRIYFFSYQFTTVIH